MADADVTDSRRSSAQLVEKVLRAIEGDSLAPVTTIKADSDSAVSLSAIKQELEAARLNEANLRMEMEQLSLPAMRPTP